LESIVAWMVALMVSVAPAGRAPATPEAKETQEEMNERYEAIAKDLVAVVYDKNEQPLFKGSQGRAKTAAVLLAIARYESDFRRDVDLGKGPLARGDGGRSWCLGQINLGEPDKNGQTPRRIGVDQNGYWVWSEPGQWGLSGPDLVNQRQNCFKAMLWMVRTSFAICGKIHKSQVEFYLNLYAGGNCMKGYESSMKRMNLAKRWLTTKKTRPPVHDDEVMTSMVATAANQQPIVPVVASSLRPTPPILAER